MDAEYFERIVRSLTNLATRRGLLRRVAAPPLAGLLAMFLGEEGEAGWRKNRRQARHRHRPGQHKGKRKGKHKEKGKGKGAAECANCPAGQFCFAEACEPCDVCAGGCQHDTIQMAIDAAQSGDTIHICPGTYTRDGTNHVAEIRDKDLTLVGAGKGSDGTILDGGGVETFNAVLFCHQTTTHLRQLAVTGANGDSGISTSSNLFSVTMTLADVSVTGNAGVTQGGGIRNTGTLTLEAGTNVTGNTTVNGGGIQNDGTLIMQAGSSVAGNMASSGGGGIRNSSEGTVTLNDGSSVTGNDAMNGSGGGIFNLDGTVTLNDGSQVTENTAAVTGGGIYNDDGTITLNPGSDVSGNFAPPGIPNDCADAIGGTSCP